jgi:transposase
MLVAKEAGQSATGGGRRRRRLWSGDAKRRIVSETFVPGASVSIAAGRHDLNANMLFTWRRQIGAVTTLPAGDAVTFVPAAITAEPTPMVSPTSSVAAGRMEIALASGDRDRVVGFRGGTHHRKFYGHI